GSLSPQFATGTKVQAKEEPTMSRFGNLFSFAAEVEAFLGRFHFAFADDGGEENPLTRYNRRRPSAPGNTRFPKNIFVGAPMVRQAGMARNAERSWATELRPTGR